MATRKKAAEAPAAPAEVRRFKPLPQEFFLEGDFDQMATELGRQVGELTWSMVDETVDGVAGHTLVATVQS